MTTSEARKRNAERGPDTTSPCIECEGTGRVTLDWIDTDEDTCDECGRALPCRYCPKEGGATMALVRDLTAERDSAQMDRADALRELHEVTLDRNWWKSRLKTDDRGNPLVTVRVDDLIAAVSQKTWRRRLEPDRRRRLITAMLNRRHRP